MTYPDEQSEYPHPDHLRVHEIRGGLRRRRRSRTSSRAPAALRALSLYSVWPGGTLPRSTRNSSNSASNRRSRKWLARLTRDEPFTTTIDITGFADVRGAALRAHATQVDPNSPFWFGLPPEVLRDIHPVDQFRLAASRVGATDVSEDDLFAGVRGS